MGKSANKLETQSATTPNFVLQTGEQSVDPTIISFSQSSVTYQKAGKPYNYDTLVSDMQSNGWTGSRLDVVNMPDGAPTSLDNTRLLAAREAGINAEVNVHNFNDPLPEQRANSLQQPDGSIPHTWGEAIQMRVQKQTDPKGWAKKYPNGSIYDPKVIKKGGKK